MKQEYQTSSKRGNNNNLHKTRPIIDMHQESHLDSKLHSHFQLIITTVNKKNYKSLSIIWPTSIIKKFANLWDFHISYSGRWSADPIGIVTTTIISVFIQNALTTYETVLNSNIAILMWLEQNIYILKSKN